MKDRHGKMVRRFLPRCEVDRKAEGELRTSFGKAAIIADAEARELPDEELLESSVARAEIEEQFKWLKDRYVVSLKPMWVRHDASVPGHMFVCVMGLMLLRYLQWEARGLRLSLKELVKRLEGIRVALVNREGSPAWVLEEMGREEAELVKRFHLREKIPESR